MKHRHKPTYLGSVSSVTGSSVVIELAPQLNSGLLVIGGRTHRVGQVGSFVRIPQGYNSLYGVISETSESSSVDDESELLQTKRRWVKVELVGEVIGKEFERGIGQYPSINDEAHIVTDNDLEIIYGHKESGQIVIGKLSSSDSIDVSVDLEKLVTRHSAVLGSTGSGKSTSVSSLLRSIVCDDEDNTVYPSSRIVLIDIHGEYSSALGDIAKTFSISPRAGEEKLLIPYWCISPYSLIDFLCGQVNEKSKNSIIDTIYQEKIKFIEKNSENSKFSMIDANRVTSQTPIPFSLKKLWYDLSFEDAVTWGEKEKENPSIAEEGDAENLVPPKFNPPATGGNPPYKGGDNILKRSLDLFRSRLLDQQYSFLLTPDQWEPSLDNEIESDLDRLLKLWLGHDKPITILDLSGIPSTRLDLLLGSLLDILFEASLWGRCLKEGMKSRPLLLVLEEAHRYLANDTSRLAKNMVRRIAKEGRKFGLGTMLVSQRPSEIDETILSQCGTFFALRINNQTDRSRVKSAMSEGISGMVDSLPVLRTGEAIVAGESAKLPMRCRFKLPTKNRYPDSIDPKVASLWANEKVDEEYDKLVVAWRNQNPFVFEK
ncbi:MAG: ATP-binding protein [Candidatus Thiodiazotropha sp.]